MKIRSLDLKAYGPFTDYALDLEKPAANGTGFHIIFGLNEAGKSTALRSLSDLLFGFPHNTTADFLHRASALRLGAEIESKSGRRLAFYRRKGRNNTLLGVDDEPLDDLALQPFIGSLTRGFFESMFGLDHDRLRKGGSDLLTGQGDLGTSLFQAASGIANLREILGGLEKERDELFKPRGTKMYINSALDELQQARQQARKQSLSGEEWRNLKRQIEALDKQLKERGDESQRLTADRSRLERILRNLPGVAERLRLLAELADLVEVPNLGKDARQQRLEAQGAILKATEARGHALGEKERLQKERAAIEVPRTVLALADEIVELQGEIGSIRNAQRDRPRREGESRQVRDRLAEMMRDLKWSGTVEELGSRLPGKAEVARIRALLKDSSRLTTEDAGLQAQHSEITMQLDSLRQELAALPALPDVGRLRVAIERVESEGQVEERLAKGQERLRHLVETAEAELASLPLFKGNLDELARLPVPLDSTVERVGRELAEAQSLCVHDTERIQDAESDLERLQGELSTLTREKEVPTAELVQRAREQREEGWRMIRRAYVDGREDVTEEAKAYDGVRPLPEAYEHRVGEADLAADLFHAEAERVSRHAALTTDLARASRRLSDEREKERLHQDARRNLEQQWVEQWHDSGIVPLPPTEMLSWLLKRRAVLQGRDQWVQSKAEVESLSGMVRELRNLLSEAMASVGQDGARENEPLQMLLRRCRSFAGQVDETAKARETLENKIHERKEDEVGLARKRQVLDGQLADWKQDWESSLGVLTCAPGTSLVEVETMLGVLDEISKTRPRWEDLEHRIRRIDEDREAFEARAAVLVRRAKPDLGTVEASQAVAALFELLQVARKDAERLEKIEQELERHESEIRKAERALEKNRAILELLCKQARCEKAEDLEEIEERSGRKRTMAERLEALERELIQGSAGLTLEQIHQEAEGSNGDEVKARKEAIEERLQACNQESITLSRERGELENTFKAMDGEDAAAAQMQRAEEAISRLRDGAERYLRLVVATTQLKRCIEAHRQTSQAPLLRRASEHFSRLTRGAFVGLTTDLSEDSTPILLGKRARGEEVGVLGMSDGTLDQLYLALRLAAIERYMEKNEPVPLIVDDVLINFDDERAAAALEVLAEVSATTQVLFFTHHARLVDLVRQAVGESRMGVHELRAG